MEENSLFHRIAAFCEVVENLADMDSRGSIRSRVNLLQGWYQQGITQEKAEIGAVVRWLTDLLGEPMLNQSPSPWAWLFGPKPPSLSPAAMAFLAHAGCGRPVIHSGSGLAATYLGVPSSSMPFVARRILNRQLPARFAPIYGAEASVELPSALKERFAKARKTDWGKAIISFLQKGQ